VGFSNRHDFLNRKIEPSGTVRMIAKMDDLIAKSDDLDPLGSVRESAGLFILFPVGKRDK
jgi:hypothetical protein